MIVGSPRPLTDSSSFRSITVPPESYTNGNGHGAPTSLSTRARSFAGSIGRSTSTSNSSRRDSVRTENGNGNGNGNSRKAIDNVSVSGESDVTGGGTGGGVLDIPQEKDKGVLKRLSSIMMRRDSGN